MAETRSGYGSYVTPDPKGRIHSFGKSLWSFAEFGIEGIAILALFLFLLFFAFPVCLAAIAVGIKLGAAIFLKIINA